MAYFLLSINYQEDHKSWDFKESGQGYKLYEEVKRRFENYEYKSKQEAFKVKDIVQMTIIPVKEKTDNYSAASICPETFFKAEKFQEIVDFVEKEYQVINK
ncbi:MAG TPA: hypothetical protein DEO65_04500 [Bacillus bacterium]|uniref:hypothetical protein n=1 Tax=Siminovitchia fordii TaxID=254759 RepID=UPI00037759FF|nr:hypothetical protein [Siminovitchia fordii]HBZ09136.1 hypothetical protein [Bacillus sp. (in: firmicutes)]